MSEMILGWFRDGFAGLRPTPMDFVEILILTVAIYQLLRWVKRTRAWILLKGFAVLLLFTLAAKLLHMDTIYWLYGKRECCVYADSSSGRKYGIASGFVYAVYCLRIFDLYLALYTLCCSYCNCAAGDGNCKSCRWYCSSTVCHCMDRCICGTWCGNDAWIIEKISYIWLFTNCRKHSAEVVRAIFFLWAIPTDSFSSPLIGTATSEG